MQVKQIMSSELQTCYPDDSLNLASSLMWEHDCGILPVVDLSGKVIGVLTDRDICMAAYTKGKLLQHIAVREIMTEAPITCMDEDSIAAAEEKLATYRIRRLPVIDANERLVGMLSLSDIARATEHLGHGKPDGVTCAMLVHTLATICTPRPEPPL